MYNLNLAKIQYYTLYKEVFITIVKNVIDMQIGAMRRVENVNHRTT